MPRIALTKGRLLEETLSWLRSRGFTPAGASDRSLTLPLGGGWEAVLLKGPDVPVFVQNGAADLGVVGSDVLEEHEPDVYDLRALPVGRCRLSLAGPAGGLRAGSSTPLRVATKYPRSAGRHLSARGLWFRTIEVASSVELAPLLGLSDVIVDLVDTGRTLRENGLVEEATLAPVRAHLVANRRAYRFLEGRWWEEGPSTATEPPPPAGTGRPGGFA